MVNHAAESGLDSIIGKEGEGGEQQLASPNGSSLPSSPFPVEQLSLLKSQSSLVNGSGSSQGPFTCEQCGLTFSQREELEKHEVSHPTPNQVCTCISFTYKLKLLKYIKLLPMHIII